MSYVTEVDALSVVGTDALNLAVRHLLDPLAARSDPVVHARLSANIIGAAGGGCKKNRSPHLDPDAVLVDHQWASAIALNSSSVS